LLPVACLAAACECGGTPHFLSDGGTGDSGLGDAGTNCTPPAPPSSLAITAAGPQSISLSWAASPSSDVTGYEVQRSPYGANSFSSVGAATALKYGDSTVDRWGAYQYVVAAQAGPGCASTPTSPVAAGAPPPGFSVVAPLPPSQADSNNAPHFGAMTAASSDGIGDPFIAFFDLDPTASGNFSNSILEVSRWDRTSFAYKTRDAATTATLPPEPADLDLSVAVDSTNGALAIAYLSADSNGVNSSLDVQILQPDSAQGQWMTQRVAIASTNRLGWPSLAMASGNVFLAYEDIQESNATTVHFLSGPQSSITGTSTNPPPAGWTDLSLPLPAGASFSVGVAASVAVDASGAPAVVYWVDNSNNPNASRALLFWQPPSAAAAPVYATSMGDTVWASLAFSKASPLGPRVAFLDLNPTSMTFPIWFTESNDVVTWSTPSNVTPDQQAGPGLTFDLAIGPSGEAALTYVSPGNMDGACGNPKLAQSLDLKSWITCSPDTNDLLGTQYSAYPTLFISGKDEVYLAFQNPNYQPAAGQLPAGVLLWRQH
jgi:hypothetical protein